MTQLSYFAKDGNYGDADGITIIDTTSWTDADFGLVEQVSDEMRPAAARLVGEWIEDQRSDKFDSYFERLGIEKGEA